MIGFESYFVSSWIDNVLTRHVAIPKKTSANTKSQVNRSAVPTLLIILASASFQPTAVANSVTIKTISLTEHTKHHSMLGDLVPKGYWPKLIAEMEHWEKLPEPIFDYPDED